VAEGAAPGGGLDGLDPRAIGAGIDTTAIVDAINEAQSQRAAARAELDGAPAPTLITHAEVYAMIDSLGDVGAALTDAEPGNVEPLYRELGIGLRYEPHERAVDVLLAPRVVNERVRGGSCALTTRLLLPAP
jgi:hypothetical protein